MYAGSNSCDDCIRLSTAKQHYKYVITFAVLLQVISRYTFLLDD